ncbi:MAG: N-acetylglucosamine kinase [Christensenellales bacterium]|jgi:N-acetylglucosamine kinase-like BadF-type ATPase
MSCLLGIDQGGTKTCAALCNLQGDLLGVGYARGACHSSSGMAAALKAIDEAVSKAAAKAAVSYDDVSLLYSGMTGADWPEELPYLESALLKHTGIKRICVANDCQIAFFAGTQRGYGAVVCAGTGVNAAFVSRDGKSENLGFFIQVNHIGRLALQAVYDAYAGVGAQTGLSRLAFAHFGRDNEQSLMRAQQSREGLSTARIKAFAPIAMKAAQEGDRAAQELCNAFASRCARYAAAMLAKAELLDIPADAVASGGIFKNEWLFSRFAFYLAEFAPKAAAINAQYEPVAGALLRALDIFGTESSAKERLVQQASAHGLCRLMQKEEC